MERVTDTIVGASSIGAIQLVPDLIPAVPHEIGGLIQLLLQLTIGVVTLLGYFRKRTPKTI